VNLTIDEGTQTFAMAAPAEDGPESAIRLATIQINTAAFAAATGAVTEYVAQAAPITTFQVLAPAAAVTVCNGTGAAACSAVAANVTSVTLNAEVTGPTGTMPNPFSSGTIFFYLVTGDVDGTPYNAAAEVWQLLGSVAGSAATFTDDGVVPPSLRHYNNTLVVSGKHPAIAGAALAGATVVAIGVNSSGAPLISLFNLNVTVAAGTF